MTPWLIARARHEPLQHLSHRRPLLALVLEERLEWPACMRERIYHVGEINGCLEDSAERAVTFATSTASLRRGPTPATLTRRTLAARPVRTLRRPSSRRRVRCIPLGRRRRGDGASPAECT